MDFKYSIFNSRPKEIFRYALINHKIEFNYNGLNPYYLKENLVIGENYKCDNSISLKEGLNGYKRKIFKEKESRIYNFLLTLIAYESLHNIKPSDNLEVYCHNGLHCDLILKTKDTYNVILYKNKLIFSNTQTRAKDNPLFAYIGIKLETILCNQPSPINDSHNKLLLKGKYGEWNFKSVVEIDSYKKSSKSEKSLDELDDDERYKKYCEIKLCLVDQIESGIFEKMNSKIELLLFLKSNVKRFDTKLKKWLFQSYFGRQDILVVGIRNNDFKLVCNEEFDVITDILPFVKQYYSILYQLFLGSIDKLDQHYSTIYKKIKSLQKSEEDLFLVDCKTLNVKRATKENSGGRTFNNILINEYLQWVNNEKDILAGNHRIDGKKYLVLKSKTIEQNLNRNFSNLNITN